MLSAAAAKLCIDDGYAIGQTFRALGKTPDFRLLEVTVFVDPQNPTSEDGSRKESLRRRYTLRTEEFECDIEEVFPDRVLFTDRVEEWLAGFDAGMKQ